jgi:hypothetical protein
MIRVDQFAAVFADLTVAPERGFGVHATADAMLRFVDRRPQAAVAQHERGGEAGDSRADDRDARGARARRACDACRRRRDGGYRARRDGAA